MISKSILSVAVSCVVILAAVFLGTGTVHGSGIFEVVTPLPGTDLANCWALAKAQQDMCGPWDEDKLFLKCDQHLAYRATWETGCHSSFCIGGSHVTQSCGTRLIVGNIYKDIYLAYGTCSKAGQSIRLMCMGGTWDPAQYEKTTIYAPDTYMVVDKNAGAPPAGMCNTSAPDGDQGMR